jgi:hypothetical protein
MTGAWLLVAFASVPFLWFGVALSVRRLRDAGVNPWLVALFVVPIVNLVFFALLAAPPTRRAAQPAHAAAVSPAAGGRRDDGFGLPGIAPAVLAIPLTVGLVWLAGALGTYGGALFLAAPFLHGLLVALLCGPRPHREVFGQFLVSSIACMTGLLVIGIEGIVCILMAAPLWLTVGGIGCLVGHAIWSIPFRVVMPAVLVVPSSMWVEAKLPPAPTVFEATTELVVARRRRPSGGTSSSSASCRRRPSCRSASASATPWGRASRAADPARSGAARSARGTSSNRSRSGTSRGCCASRCRSARSR